MHKHACLHICSLSSHTNLCKLTHIWYTWTHIQAHTYLFVTYTFELLPLGVIKFRSFDNELQIVEYIEYKSSLCIYPSNVYVHIINVLNIFGKHLNLYLAFEMHNSYFPNSLIKQKFIVLKSTCQNSMNYYTDCTRVYLIWFQNGIISKMHLRCYFKDIDKKIQCWCSHKMVSKYFTSLNICRNLWYLQFW